MLSTGFAFGVGGVAHHYLFRVHEAGDVCGSWFTESNGLWMYPWCPGEDFEESFQPHLRLLSMLTGAFSPSALLAMLAQESRYSHAVMIISYGVAVVSTIVEVKLMLFGR